MSAVIPTCDRPDLVLESLDSVAAQTRLPDEVVVVDNGKTPLTLTQDGPFPLRLTRAFPRFGVAQARNLGAVMATGDYVSFLDDDDRWDSAYLEEVERTILESGADVVLGRLRDLRDQRPLAGKQAAFGDPPELLRLLLRRNPGAVGSSVTVARPALLGTSGYDPRLTTGEDKAIIIDLLQLDASVARAEGAWVDYRVESTGERQTETRKLRQGKLRFLRKYWRQMTWRIRLGNMGQLVRIQADALGAPWR